MPLPNPTVAPCVGSPSGGPGSSGTVQCAGDNPGCEEDLEWAADHPAECPNAEAIVGLEVKGPTVDIEVGGYFGFEANLLFSGGAKQRVTDKATWTSAAPSIAATQSQPGGVIGISIGSTTIRATYRGLTDSAPITIVAKCVGIVPLDIVLVIDRSGSMQNPEGNRRPRMDNTLKAAENFVRNVDFTKDRVAVVSFAGYWYRQTGNTTLVGTLRTSNTTLHTGLSSDLPTILEGLADIDTALNSSCTREAAPFIPGYELIVACATGIGTGMVVGGDLLRTTARPSARKFIILMTDGEENICEPDPDPTATALKAEGVTFAVIAVAVFERPADPCPQNPTLNVSTFERMLGWSSCELFFEADTAEDLPSIYASLPRYICQQLQDEDSCLSYYYA